MAFDPFASQEATQDVLSRAGFGSDKRKRRQALSEARYSPTSFTSDFASQIGEAQQPSEFWGAGRKLGANQNVDPELANYAGANLSKLGGDYYYYGDPSNDFTKEENVKNKIFQSGYKQTGSQLDPNMLGYLPTNLSDMTKFRDQYFYKGDFDPSKYTMGDAYTAQGYQKAAGSIDESILQYMNMPGYNLSKSGSDYYYKGPQGGRDPSTWTLGDAYTSQGYKKAASPVNEDILQYMKLGAGSQLAKSGSDYYYRGGVDPSTYTLADAYRSQGLELPTGTSSNFVQPTAQQPMSPFTAQNLQSLMQPNKGGPSKYPNMNLTLKLPTATSLQDMFDWNNASLKGNVGGTSFTIPGLGGIGVGQSTQADRTPIQGWAPEDLARATAAADTLTQKLGYQVTPEKAVSLLSNPTTGLNDIFGKTPAAPIAGAGSGLSGEGSLGSIISNVGKNLPANESMRLDSIYKQLTPIAPPAPVTPPEPWVGYDAIKQFTALAKTPLTDAQLWDLAQTPLGKDLISGKITPPGSSGGGGSTYVPGYGDMGAGGYTGSGGTGGGGDSLSLGTGGF